MYLYCTFRSIKYNMQLDFSIECVVKVNFIDAVLVFY